MRLLFIYCLFKITCLNSLEKPLTAIICSYNNKDWYQKNLSSVLSQKYENYKIIYIDDYSTDNTGELVENYLNSKDINYKKIEFTPSNTDHELDAAIFKDLINDNPHKITIVRNKIRSQQLANFYRAALSCQDDTVILRIDGDDWLKHNQVFQIINDAYNNPMVWLTHGTLIHYPIHRVEWSMPVPEEYIDKNSFRQSRCPSHLLTCYAWLYKKVLLEDQLENNQFISAAADQAIIFPMIEMAGDRHAFISTPIYVYNQANKINVRKVQSKLQRNMEALIRSKKPYEKLPVLE